MSDTKPNYDESLKEIQDIVSKLESGEAGIDEMSELIKRASYLLQHCQNTLRKLETDIENTLGEEGSQG